MGRLPAHEGAQAQRESFSFVAVNDADSRRNSNSDLMQTSCGRETLGQALESIFVSPECSWGFAEEPVCSRTDSEMEHLF